MQAANALLSTFTTLFQSCRVFTHGKEEQWPLAVHLVFPFSGGQQHWSPELVLYHITETSTSSQCSDCPFSRQRTRILTGLYKNKGKSTCQSDSGSSCILSVNVISSFSFPSSPFSSLSSEISRFIVTE